MSIFTEEKKSITEIEMKYLVLKMKDGIDIDFLIKKWQRFKKLGKDDYYSNVDVEMIACDLVNAVLRNK
jgi:hypothetical protein